jgi:hypothetical protein
MMVGGGDVERLCDEYNIKIVDGRAYPSVGETRAVGTLRTILEEKGEAHLRMVLMTLAETENNRAYLDRYLWDAVSQLVSDWHGVIERNASAWLAIWDRIPVGQLQYMVSCMGPPTRKTAAIYAVLYERLFRTFGPHANQGDLFDEYRA